MYTLLFEQLCYFCLCSKTITQNYENVKDYLYNYLSKEFDMLQNFLNQNKVSFNFKEIYLGGGSPTYYKEEEFKYLIKKMRSLRFFKNWRFTIEVDPRR